MQLVVFLLLIHLMSGSICSHNLTDITEAISQNMRMFHNVQNRSVINEPFNRLFNVMNLKNASEMDYRENPINSYVGYDNNDFYMIKDCRYIESYCSNVSNWKHFGSPIFLGYVRNTFIFGDPRRHVFELDNEGNLGRFLTTTKEYPTTERTWYSQSDGWGEQYKFASTQHLMDACSSGGVQYGQTFTERIENGVIGLDSYEVCQKSDITRVKWMGWNYCDYRVDQLCEDGESDCHVDADCAGELVCFQRENQELREGYDFSPLADVVGGAGADVCVVPIPPEKEKMPLDLLILLVFVCIAAAFMLVYAAHQAKFFTWVEEFVLKESMLSILGVCWDVLEIISLYVGYFGSIQYNPDASDFIKVLFIITIGFSTLGFIVCIYIRFHTLIWEVVFPTKKLINSSSVHQLSTLEILDNFEEDDPTLSPSSNKQNATDKIVEHLQRTHEEFTVLYHNTTADIVCLLLLDLPQSFLGLYYMVLYNVTDLVFIICLTIQLISLGLFASSISTRTHAKKLISVTQQMFEEQERVKSQNMTRLKAPFRRRTTFADDDDSDCTTESNRSRSMIAGFKFPTVPNIFGKDYSRKHVGKSKSPLPSPSPNSAVHKDPPIGRGESPRRSIRRVQSAPQIAIKLKKQRRSSKSKNIEKGEKDHESLEAGQPRQLEGEERGEISILGVDFDKSRTLSNSSVLTSNTLEISNTPRNSNTFGTPRNSTTFTTPILSTTPRHSNTIIHSNSPTQSGTPRHSNTSINSTTFITAMTPSKTSKKLQFVQTKQRRNSGRANNSSQSNSRSMPKCPTLTKNHSTDSIGSLKFKSKPGRENPSKPGTPVSMSV